jgi:uncharacterized phiE125 gp8 family phage protein
VTLCALADVKTYLGITDTNSDTVLTALVVNASAMCEAFCNRVFAQASYTETRNGSGKAAMTLANAPVSAVASVSVDGLPVIASASPTLGGYVFDADTLYLRAGVYPCTFTAGVQNVVVTYTAGFATIPPDVAQACIELVALKYAKRNRIDKASETLGTQQTISYTMADMPASVKTALKPYVRWGSP